MNRTTLRLVGAMLGVALVATACGAPKGGGTTAAAAASTTTTLAPGNVDASDYRTAVTSLLEEHVYLTGIQVSATLAGADASGPAAQVERNTAALQSSVETALGTATATSFGAAWRRQSQAFLSYAKAKAAGAQAGVDQAKADLDADRASLAAAFDAGTTGNLGVAAASDQIKTHNDAIRSAIDSMAAKKANQFAQLKRAADKMPDFADTFVVACVKAKPAVFRGSSTTGRALLLSTLTAALQSHAYLVAMTTSALLTGGDVANATAALDTNSVDLANLLGAVYGDSGNQQFLALWRKHVGFFLDYTRAKAANDPAGAAAANANLDGYRSDFGAFIESATKGTLSKAAVADDLAGHVRTLEAAIDAQASKSADQVAVLAEAAAHMHGTAQALTDALAKQFPDRFPEA